ncbi:MAG: hypothetical protein ACRC3H_18190 [Lachnospiraceae bacterium]
MIDANIEKEIVELFFNKKIKKRVEYELSSKRKRIDAFFRLNESEVLNQKTIHPIYKVDQEDVIQKLIELGASENKAYFMGYTEEDGYVTLAEAVDMAFYFGMPAIVYCGNGIGYIQGEQSYGPPERYLLIAINHS